MDAKETMRTAYLRGLTFDIDVCCFSWKCGCHGARVIVGGDKRQPFDDELADALEQHRETIADLLCAPVEGEAH